MTPSTRPLWRPAAATVAVSVVWVAAVCLVLGNTTWGQRLDDAAFAGSDLVGPRVVQAHDGALSLITNASLAAGCIGLVVIGIARSRLLLGVCAAVAVGGAAVTTEVLKRVVPERPELNDAPAHLIHTDFPSGHATVSAALALAFVMVTPHRWRTPTAVLAGLWVAFQGTGVVAAAWHRPSDALAGYAVALAWASLALVALDAMGHVRPYHEEEHGSEHTTAAVLIAVGALLVGLLAAAPTFGDVDLNWSGVAFVLAVSTIDVAAFAALWWFHRMLRPWSLGLVPSEPVRRPPPARARGL